MDKDFGYSEVKTYKMFQCEGGDEPGDDQPEAGRGGETTLSCKFKGTVSRD